METKYDIFISYCHEDVCDVEKITNLFDQNGIKYWIDSKSIPLGVKYQEAIVCGIESSDIFLFVYSIKSNDSADQIRELGIASKANKLIIPFMLDNSEWKPELRYMASSNQGIEVWKEGMGMDFALKVLVNGIRNRQAETQTSSTPSTPEPVKISHHSQPMVLNNDDVFDLDYDDALDFMQDGDLQEAMHSLQASFENGNGNTILLFNKLLFQNFGNIDWDEETWEFLEQQVIAGHSFAHLAYFYKFQHNKETHQKAVEHLKEARADKQNGYAILCEGIAREKGIGMRPNLHSATKCYKKAYYEVGITEAVSYFAEMNLNGNSGLEINKEKAIDILTKGYEQDDARSCYILGSIYKESAYQKENWEKAVSYFKRAVDLQRFEAWIDLGNLYRYNRFSEDYNDEALSCYLQALKNGVKDAHAYIARQYWDDDRQEDAIIEAQKGEKANNVLSISMLGSFYEEGLQEEGLWIRQRKPDYSKAWNYYRKAFSIGGRIEDAVSMARLYVKDEYRPQDISWEVIEGYLKQAAQIPIIEALELMIEALKKNGREKDAIQYLKIGAESGSLPMMHEYGIYLQSTDIGEALRLIEEAGKNKYRPSVEWLLNYYKTFQTRSKKDYEKWMDIAVEMKIEVPLKDYIPYIVEKDKENAKAYLLNSYSDSNLESLLWITKYYTSFDIDNQWLLNEIKSRYDEIANKWPSIFDAYSDFLLETDNYEEYETFHQMIAHKNQFAGQYLSIKKEISLIDGISKELAQRIYNIGNDDTVPFEWKCKTTTLLYSLILNRKKTKILIVGGEKSSVMLLKILLVNEKFSVCTANSAQSCIEMAKEEKPSLILLDRPLPDMTSMVFISQLNDNPATKDIPIILLYIDISETRHLPKSVIHDFISKPFYKEELVTKVIFSLKISNLLKLIPEDKRIVEKKGKILLVDDVMTNILHLKLLLANEKYQMITANNGSSCIEQAKKECPDVIVMDVMMPDMSGFDTAVILKKNPETKNIPIMFLTALNSPADLIHGLQVGAQFFLTKPCDKEEFLLRIKKILLFQNCFNYFIKN